MKNRAVLSLSLLLFIAIMTSSLFARSIEERIEKHILSNGATLILLPREEVPIVSCITMTEAGGAKEKPGITGISHFLEHLAFKGTETIGTQDYEAEQKALEECHQIFDILLAERKKRDDADAELLSTLEKELQEAISKANEYSIENDFSNTLELNGSKGLNAGTAQDMTMYEVNIPANKLELWMLMEADRFTNPVFREFYQEREVILEERRMIYGNPTRAFMEEFKSFAFQENPYRFPIIGEQEDIENFTVKDIEKYFEEHYGAENLVFALVGDIDTKATLAMANKYLAKIPSRKKSEKVIFNEPEPKGERRFVSESTAQPFLLISYPAPASSHPDFYLYYVIAAVLGGGRSSRLHYALVEEKKLAIAAFCYSGYPESTRENLMLIGVMPNQGVAIDDCIEEIDHQISQLVSNNVTEEELKGIKKRFLKLSYDRLESSFGLAYQLAHYECLRGDYKLLFKELEKVQSIERHDLDRILKTAFNKQHRVIGELRTKETEQ